METERVVTLLFVSLICTVGTTSSLSISPRNMTVLEGENATIACHGVYLDDLKILALSDEVFATITRPHQRAEPQGNSILVNVTFHLPYLTRQEDGLMLRCVQLDLHSDIAAIHVFVPPRLVAVNGSMVYLMESKESWSKSIYFQVSDGYPTVTGYVWKLNDTVLPGDHRYDISCIVNSTSLRIKGPTRQDSGHYVVITSGPSGTSTADTRLIVMYDEFLQVPTSVDVYAGESAVFHCNHRFGWVYSWHSPTSLNHTHRKVQLSSDGKVLTYGPVTAGDMGLEVWCNVRGLDRETIFTSTPAARLTVMAPPFISVSDMAVVTSEVDSEVILNFHVVSFTADVILSYEHNGSPLDTSSSHYRLLEHGALLIKHPRGRDAGNYMLHATNSLGTTSALILLTVQYKPVITELEESCEIFQVNKLANVPCGKIVHGYPLPGYSWKRCHTSSPSSSSPDDPCQSELLGNESTLSLTNANYSDSGNYQCTASNHLGQDSTSVCVEVLAPPNPPIGVMVRSSADDHTHNNLFLSWSPPATETTEAPVSGYKVQATPLPTTYGTATLVPGMILENSACIEVVCEGVEEVVGGRGSGSVTLTSLLPGLTYNFTVSSLSHGLRLQSMPSETIYRTNNGVPGVGSVTAQARGPGTAHLSWTLAFSGGVAVSHFVIEYRLQDSVSKWYQASTVPWNQTSTVLGNQTSINRTLPVPGNLRQSLVYDLEAESLYLFRVAAVNQLGMGNFTQTPQAIHSDAEGVPSPPTRPLIMGWGPNKVILSTSIPNIGSNLSTFRLVALSGGSSPRLTASLSLEEYQDGDTITLTGENTRYHGDLTFQVYAVNSLGPSLLSGSSLQAGENVQLNNNNIPSDEVGLAAFVFMMLVDVMATVVAIVFCGLTWLESRKKERSIARRIEIVQETPKDGPLSPFSDMLRSSPDGRCSNILSASVSTPTAEMSEVFSLPVAAAAPTVLKKAPDRICYRSQLGKQ